MQLHCNKLFVTSTKMTEIFSNVDKDQVLNALGNITEKVTDLLNTAKQRAQDSVQQFAQTDINALGPSIGIYADAFLRLGVTTRKAFDSVLCCHLNDQDVQNAVHELDELETDWNIFLKKTDSQLAKDKSQPKLHIGSPGPCDIEIKDARTGCDHVADLQKRAQEVSRCGGYVVVISFGPKEGAMNWLDQTGCTFDMFLDADRQIYTAMGLGISIAKVWGIATMMYYADMKAMGRVLPSAAANIQDDPLQMGGDLVLDCHGNTALIHCSKTPPDRPTVDTLIDILKGLQLPESSRPEFEDGDEPPKKILRR